MASKTAAQTGLAVTHLAALMLPQQWKSSLPLPLAAPPAAPGPRQRLGLSPRLPAPVLARAASSPLPALS